MSAQHLQPALSASLLAALAITGVKEALRPELAVTARAPIRQISIYRQ